MLGLSFRFFRCRRDNLPLHFGVSNSGPLVNLLGAVFLRFFCFGLRLILSDLLFLELNQPSTYYGLSEEAYREAGIAPARAANSWFGF